MKRIFPIISCLCLLAASCSSGKQNGKAQGYSENRARMEEQAQQMLQQARGQLAAGQPGQAKATIQAMRKQCYLAIDARKEGILLMDSAYISQAKAELARVDSLMQHGAAGDSLKAQFEEACRQVQFYEHRLMFDKKK